MKEFDEMSYQGEPNRTSHSWGQIFVSVAAVIATFVGAKIDGFNWVLYLTVPLLIVAFVLMVVDTKGAKWVIRSLRIRRDR